MTRARCVGCLTAVLGLGLAPAAFGAVEFGAEAVFQSNGYIAAGSAGDLNADGNVDLLAPYAFNPTIGMPGTATKGVLVLLGDGRGRATSRNQALGVALQSIATGDFDGNGKLDAAGTFDDGTNAGVVVLAGDGAGGLTETAAQNAGAHPAGIVSANFNGDGATDVALLDTGTNDVLVMLGAPTGGFVSPKRIPLSRTPSAIAPADVDSDGKVDLVVSTAGSVAILRGDGAGNFATAEEVAVVEPSALAVGDLNADGRPDIAVVSTTRQAAVVLLARPEGGFAEMPLPVAGPSPRGIAIADLDLDGIKDLGIFGYESGAGTFGIYLGDGRGSFTGHATVRSQRVGGLIADFNRDGAPDIVLGTGTPPTSRTVSGSIAVDFNLPIPAGESLDFGRTTVRLGTRTRTMTLRNLGAAPMHVVAISLGTGSRHFSIVGDGCSGRIVPRQATCAVRIAFHPRRLGLLTAGVVVTADWAVDTHSFPLTGIGKRIAGLGIRHRTLRLDDRGRIHLRVSCPGPRRCKGLVTIRTASAVVLRTPGIPRRVTIGRARVRMRAGARRTVAVAATPAARNLVRRLGRVAVTVRVSKEGAYVRHASFRTHLRKRRG
jgi:VCBS repeat protein